MRAFSYDLNPEYLPFCVHPMRHLLTTTHIALCCFMPDDRVGVPLFPWKIFPVSIQGRQPYTVLPKSVRVTMVVRFASTGLKEGQDDQTIRT